MRSWLNTAVVAAWLLCLAGCTQSPPAMPSVQALLAQANQATGTQRDALLLQAAEQQLDRQQASAATELLNAVSDPLNPSLALEQSLVQTHIWQQQGRWAQANQLLRRISAQRSALTDAQRRVWYQLVAASAQHRGDVVGEIQAVSARAAQLPQAAQQAALQSIWHSLNTMSLRQLHQGLNEGGESSPWFQLALVMRLFAHSAFALAEQLAHWQTQYPEHIAQSLFVANEDAASLTQVNSVACLLPLSGQQKSLGLSIEQGILEGYYQMPLAGRPRIQFFDTAYDGVAAAYQQALASGAQAMLAYLSPAERTQLQQMASSTPLLLLNGPPDSASLPPAWVAQANRQQQELRAIAQHLSAVGQQRIWLLYDQQVPPDQLQDFVKQLRAAGTYWVGQTDVGQAGGSLSAQMADVLEISQSQQRAKTWQTWLGRKLRFVARRRQDIDAIVMLVNHSNAHQVRPRLQYDYAGSVPTYMLSSAYVAHERADLLRDLQGVMLWVTADQCGLLGTLPHTDPVLQQFGSGSANQLTSTLGLQGYRLMMTWPQWSRYRLLGVFGVHGLLWLDAQHRLVPQLLRARVGASSLLPVNQG